MSYSYTQQAEWLLPNSLNLFTVQDKEYARLHMPSEFDFPFDKIEALKEAYRADEEKGGLIFFTNVIEEGRNVFRAVELQFITNVTSKDKRISYKPDSNELNIAFKNALSKKLFPLSFHTHPTVYINEESNLVMQGMNFLHQLNTSPHDQAATLWSFSYNNVKVRLPQILIVENAGALFIGFYGGLVAPLCFTEQKDKAIQVRMENIFEGVKDWADTPKKQAAIILSILGLFFLAMRFPKVAIPTVIGAGIVAPPLLYSTQKINEFFGVSYKTDLRIQIPKLLDSEIIQYELKAIEAQEEARKIDEAEKNNKSKGI